MQAQHSVTKCVRYYTVIVNKHANKQMAIKTVSASKVAEVINNVEMMNVA